MPYDPTDCIGEVLGVPAQKGFNPATQNYECPFLKSPCVKRSTSLETEPYPVCSILANVQNERRHVCVCPKRFHGVDFLKDVVKHCWPDKPQNIQIAPEVKMTGFGNVDFVIADINESGDVGHFLSVELQAIDITGSVMKAYKALRAGDDLPKKPTYGLNWDNVYKRYITQLIRKGYFHHHWGTKIVAVMQDAIYHDICKRAEFMRTQDVQNSTVNIIFMAYKFEEDKQKPGWQHLTLETVEGTSHANLQHAILYKEPPSREAFCSKIKQSVRRQGQKIK